MSAIAEDVATERREPGQVLVLTNWAALGTRVRTRLVELGVRARTYFKEQALRSDDARKAVAMYTTWEDKYDAMETWAKRAWGGR